MEKFSSAFDLLEKIQAPKAKNTVAQTKSVLKHLRPFFDSRELVSFEKDYEETWSEYITHVGGKRKLAHDRRYLTMALKRAHRKGWINRAFIKSDLPLKESHKPIGRALEDDEVQRLLKALSRWPKAYLQALMALTMGMRRSEILQLRWDEIDLTRAEIHLDPSRLKTRQPRKVPIPIHEKVLPELQKLNALRGGGYTFSPRWFMALFANRKGRSVITRITGRRRDGNPACNVGFTTYVTPQFRIISEAA